MYNSHLQVKGKGKAQHSAGGVQAICTSQTNSPLHNLHLAAYLHIHRGGVSQLICTKATISHPPQMETDSCPYPTTILSQGFLGKIFFLSANHDHPFVDSYKLPNMKCTRTTFCRLAKARFYWRTCHLFMFFQNTIVFR